MSRRRGSCSLEFFAGVVLPWLARRRACGARDAAAVERIVGLVVTDLSLPSGRLCCPARGASGEPGDPCGDRDGLRVARLRHSCGACRCAHDYLTKPFSLSQLEVILDRIHDRMALEASNRRLQLAEEVADYLERPGGETLEHRLTAIERSLACIERALGHRRH